MRVIAENLSNGLKYGVELFFLKTVTKLATKPAFYTYFKLRYNPSPLIN